MEDEIVPRSRSQKVKKFDLSSYFSSRDVSGIIGRMEERKGFGIGVGGISPLDSLGKMELVEREEKIEEASKKIRCEYELRGLRIGVNYHYFGEGNILSLSGEIVNHTDQPISHLFRISSFLESFCVRNSERIKIHSFKGGIADVRYPPISFTHRESELISWIAEGTTVSSSLGTAHFNGGLRGRSTDNDMPYLLIELGEGKGLFFALEWPGDWSSCIKRIRKGNREKLVCDIGLENLDFTLLPQERIPLPGCLIGFYEGDWIDGCNTLRKTIVKYYIPKLNGDSIVPPVFYDHWFGLGLSCGEQKMRDIAEVAAQIGSEYFVLDAGWYAGCGMKGGDFSDFSPGIGNWKVPHPDKYPQGLKPLSEFVNKKGMKFGLWIEPERCDKGSLLAKDHPDWIISDPKGGFRNLVDFSNPEVICWFKDTFDRIFEENKIEWIRFDSNIDPQYNWKQKDVPGREGILQIRHFEGLFNLWDHLLEKHPTLLIEGVASGGRRMDLACLKRSHTYWCNDHTEHPDIVRWDSRVNLIIPANYLNHAICLKSNKNYPNYVYNCFFGGSLGFSDDLTTWSEKKIDSTAAHVKIFKDIRHLLMKEFSPLFNISHSLDSWDGWQWHDEEKSEGLIVVFRALSSDKTKRVDLRWIKEDKNYELLDLYSGKKEKVYGKRLSLEGLLFSLMPRSSAVIKYRALNKG